MSDDFCCCSIFFVFLLSVIACEVFVSILIRVNDFNARNEVVRIKSYTSSYDQMINRIDLLGGPELLLLVVVFCFSSHSRPENCPTCETELYV